MAEGALPSAILSQTLQTLTNVKFTEINKQRQQYTLFRENTLKKVNESPMQHDRINSLLDATEQASLLNDNWSDTSERNNIRRLFNLSRYDPSVPQSLLDSFEARLREVSDAKMRTLDFANLYARLLREWISPPASTIDNVHQTPAASSKEGDEDFQLVERDRLQQLREKFADHVFTAKETDEVEIDNYLRSAFKGEEGEKTLNAFRSGVREMCDDLLKQTKPFNVRTIRQCIKGLFSEDLLKDEKKTMLEEFEKNETVLNEMADVLNLRYADLKNWTWDAPNGLAVEPRKQLNGKYRVMADEDVMQAIFLHYIANRWAVYFKLRLIEMIKQPRSESGVWREASTVPLEHVDRREFFTDSRIPSVTMESLRRTQFLDSFLPNLPANLDENTSPYDDNDAEQDMNKKKEQSSNKQQILRRLAAEIAVRQGIGDDVAVLQGDMAWYAPDLPHSTIIAVLRFFGVDDFWLDFFRKFVQQPLNMDAGLDGTSGQAVTRLRGTPIASLMAVWLGEMVLFGMDLVVNNESGLLLYRMHDDFWVTGYPEQVEKAWSAINSYVKVTGLELNLFKCGSKVLTNGERGISVAASLPKGDVDMGFLKLDESTRTWIIDQENVSAHIKQLRTQLSACTSVFEWVTTWNSCIGRFFTSSFGEPAFCFGRSHLDSILETHGRIQRELLAGSGSNSVNDYLRKVISSRFSIPLDEIPNAFLFLPQRMGGMGLKNPFLPLFKLRNALTQEPSEIMAEFLRQERENYKDIKKAYEARSERENRNRIRRIWGEGSRSQNVPKLDEPFMSFEEWTSYREQMCLGLGNVYSNLMDVPSGEAITITYDLTRLFGVRLTTEEQWVVMMYKDELMSMFGGLRIVQDDLLPLGVLEMMNKRKVIWSMRL